MSVRGDGGLPVTKAGRIQYLTYALTMAVQLPNGDPLRRKAEREFGRRLALEISHHGEAAE